MVLGNTVQENWISKPGFKFVRAVGYNVEPNMCKKGSQKKKRQMYTNNKLELTTFMVVLHQLF